MNLSHEEKMSMLAQLIRMAAADGEHRDEEYNMLNDITEALRVEPMDMEALFTKKVSNRHPADEAVRVNIFHHLLQMVWSDGEMDPDEAALLKELGMSIGLPMQAIETSMQKSHLYNRGQIPQSEIENIFKVHNN